MTEYSIHKNTHDFACWAAGRAASVRSKGKSSNVASAKGWLKSAGLDVSLKLEDLPETQNGFDQKHREYCRDIIEKAGEKDHNLEHGQAAKLANVYLKSRFVNEQSLQHKAVRYIHPPIDRLLLLGLGCKKKNWGAGQDGWNGEGKYWRRMAIKGWSNFSCPQYEELIEKIITGLNGEPLWMIEKYWPGHQS